MHLTRITSAKKHGFKKKSLHVRKERPGQAALYLKQKSSFFMAALSLVAFVAGNMAGEHGWYAFMKAVLGNADDSLITYTGTVSPIEFVPDYSKWQSYGGDSEQHTYRQVPKDLLIPLPSYDQSSAKKGLDMTGTYSVGNMGSYDSGAENGGSHPGVDIRVPVGTPIRSIANGIVTQVRNDAGGYGLFIVVRHPHMPDPARPTHETVLHSAYAHLSSQLVEEGDIVEKGQLIGLSGQSGFVTGAHLHFQVDRDEAPWHPYWPFTGAEARAAGLTTTKAVNSGFHQERLQQFTVHPMLLVQANYKAPNTQRDDTAAVALHDVRAGSRRTKEQISQLRADRRSLRLARRETVALRAAAPTDVTHSTVIDPKSIAPGSIALALPDLPTQRASGNPVASFDLQYPRRFSGREWLTVRITLLDESGMKTSEDQLTKDIYLRTAFGEAEFNPPVLRQEDFTDGVATVEMLPRGRRTVVLLLQPYAFQGQPMEYKE